MAPKPKKKLTPYNRHVQKQMKAGKSMKQAASSWSKKSGKPKAAASKSTGSKSKSKSTGGRSQVAKNSFNTQKIFKYLRIGALALPAVGHIMNPALNTTAKIHRITKDYTGYNNVHGTWSFMDMVKGYLPFIGTSVITYGIPKLMKMIRSF